MEGGAYVLFDELKIEVAERIGFKSYLRQWTENSAKGRIGNWPGGNGQAAFEIGCMEVTNVSTAADVDAYAASITQRSTSTLGVPSFVQNVTVASYARRGWPQDSCGKRACPSRARDRC